MVNQPFSLVSIERLAKYPDVGSSRSSRVLTGINSGEQTGSSSFCVWQPAMTHRPLMWKKSGSEELFQKNCFRSTVSEDFLSFLAITIDQPVTLRLAIHLNLAYCSQSTPLSPCNHKNINCRSDWRDQGRIERGKPTPGHLWM